MWVWRILNNLIDVKVLDRNLNLLKNIYILWSFKRISTKMVLLGKFLLWLRLKNPWQNHFFECGLKRFHHVILEEMFSLVGEQNTRSQLDLNTPLVPHTTHFFPLFLILFFLAGLGRGSGWEELLDRSEKFHSRKLSVFEFIKCVCAAHTAGVFCSQTASPGIQRYTQTLTHPSSKPGECHHFFHYSNRISWHKGQLLLYWHFLHDQYTVYIIW